MTAILGLFMRTPDGQAAREVLEPRARSRLGLPVHADDHIMLWCDADGQGVDPECPAIAAGIVHNRSELAETLGGEAHRLGDHALIRHAFARWGTGACGHIHGDWIAALWDPRDRALVLARDPFGYTALYYHMTPHLFAFASRREDLWALGLAGGPMNELFVAQVLVSWFAYHGETTVDSAVNRLPPAHFAHVTPDAMKTRCYWRLQDVPEVRLPRREDYAERMAALLDRAVADRLPARGGVAVALSSGLDSGSVAAAAAPALARSGRRLVGYVSTPIADTAPFVGRALGDEYALAAETARAIGSTDLRRIEAAGISPVAAVRDILAITGEPQHSASGFFWILELFRTAAREGNATVLTGQLGNSGISWTGGETAWPLRMQIAREGLVPFAKARLRKAMPGPLDRACSRFRAPRDYPTSAISLDFARRLKLRERRLDDPVQRPHPSSRDQRFIHLRPGATKIGAFYAEIGRALGITISDPTGDPRLLAFCLSVPDPVYVDPETGMDRWLVREAMKGRLPDSVRLNRRFGRQSGDLVLRLRMFAADVEEALDEIEHGPGAACVDIPRMRACWRRVQTETGRDVLGLAGTLLMRGIMAGLFVNGYGRAGMAGR